MSGVQTAYLIAEVVAIPLTGFTRLLSMCWLFVVRLVFTLASVDAPRATISHAIVAVSQGFSGARFHPPSLSAVFPPVSSHASVWRPRSLAYWRCLRRPSD
jgi:hypothetical protein